MDLLTEELQELISHGKVLLAMDGNGKIGILGEEKSRNGKLLLEVFRNSKLNVMNMSEKCEGKITRINRKKPDEKSAIDFVVATEEIKRGMKTMIIDEDGHFRL